MSAADPVSAKQPASAPPPPPAAAASSSSSAANEVLLAKLQSENASLKESVQRLESHVLTLEEKINPSISKVLKASGTYSSADDLPPWVESLGDDIRGIPVDDSFNSEYYRQANGFKGVDYVHSEVSGLKLGTYKLYSDCYSNSSSKDFPRVENAVHFNGNAEGAKGWVHRGALCALMDDAANWAGFNVSGELNVFSGFTSRVDTTLRRPVRVNAALKLVAQILDVSNRTDVIIKCSLIDPAYSNAVHCEANCVFVMNESAAEMLEPLVADRIGKKGKTHTFSPAGKEEGGGAGGWSAERNFSESVTAPDPAFRPPNRVGRYGVGQKIDDEVAAKIDERVARNFVPSSGNLMKSAERAAIKKKAEKLEKEKLEDDDAQKNHPARTGLPTLSWAP